MPDPNATTETKRSIRSAILGRHGLSSGREALKQVGWESMNGGIQNALKHLLRGRDALRTAYQKHIADRKQATEKSEMSFALDGRLVGDIGELIAADVFCLDLLGGGSANVDAVTNYGPKRQVQIKATFKEDGLEIKHGGDHFIGLQLNDKGGFRVVYNGPAEPVMNYLKSPATTGKLGRIKAGTRLEPISLEAWATLNLGTTEDDQIPRRQPTTKTK